MAKIVLINSSVGIGGYSMISRIETTGFTTQYANEHMIIRGNIRITIKLINIFGNVRTFDTRIIMMNDQTLMKI